MSELEFITLEDSLLIKHKGKNVKCLALIDIVSSVLNIVLSPVLALAAFISLLFGTYGYMGAKNLDKCQTRVYVIYLIMQVIFQVLFIIIYLINPSLFGSAQVNEATLFYNTIFFCINFFVTQYISSFYTMISQYSQFSLNNLLKPDTITIVHGESVSV